MNILQDRNIKAKKGPSMDIKQAVAVEDPGSILPGVHASLKEKDGECIKVHRD